MDDIGKHIEDEAVMFAKAHKHEIARELTSVTKFPVDTAPVSVFMAGSPGAGKTESSIRLVERFSGDGHTVLRIDADELRIRFAGYDGKNSSLFQYATSIIADRMQDLALDQGQSYVFDGTLTNLDRARENITRNLKHGRLVQIIYVYQDPLQAWKFVQERERRDGRMIPRQVFIDQYCMARENVNALKREFGKKIKVDLVSKNIDGTNFAYFENVDQIDSHIPERYTRKDLESLIK